MKIRILGLAATIAEGMDTLPDNAINQETLLNATVATSKDILPKNVLKEIVRQPWSVINVMKLVTSQRNVWAIEFWAQADHHSSLFQINFWKRFYLSLFPINKNSIKYCSKCQLFMGKEKVLWLSLMLYILTSNSYTQSLMKMITHWCRYLQVSLNPSFQDRYK